MEGMGRMTFRFGPDLAGLQGGSASGLGIVWGMIQIAEVASVAAPRSNPVTQMSGRTGS